MSESELLSLFLKSTGICTDTRSIKSGNLFFALKGANFNGNIFAEKALEAGAIACIVDQEPTKPDPQIFVVHDALDALQSLARVYRRHLDPIIIFGIGGSNGKTTSKELIAAILSTSYKTFATKGNLNNHIGVPLSLLSIPLGTDIAVIEMGANHLDELALLCSIAEPNAGLITNAGKDHLEGYGSVESVAVGNGELYEWLRNTKGTAFVNESDALMHSQAAGISDLVFFGKDEKVEVVAQNPFLELTFHGKRIRTHLFGTYNAFNIESAIKVGLYYQISLENCIKAVEAYQPTNNRSQLKNTAFNILILDCYNANPSSMLVALKSLSAMSHSRKIAILGDMFELGTFSESEHIQILANTIQLSIDEVWVCGSSFYDAAAGFPQVKRFISRETLAMELSKNQLKGALVLLKGSRSMAMEKLVEYL